MAFTKDELKHELRAFMVGLAVSAERVFGPNRGGALLGYPDRSAHDVKADDAQLDSAWLWNSVLTMYDYGIEGQPHPSFGANGDGLQDQYGEAELFLLGLDSMAPFLEEDEVAMPKLAQRTVQTAVARHVLDGGERYTVREGDEPAGYLSFAEVALLAEMDERSVRNAANPKLADALVVKNFGRRTLIAVGDARHWLTGRKGYVPTLGADTETKETGTNMSSLEVPYEVITRLVESARDAKMTTWELLSHLLDKQDIDARQIRTKI